MVYAPKSAMDYMTCSIPRGKECRLTCNIAVTTYWLTACAQLYRRWIQRLLFTVIGQFLTIRGRQFDEKFAIFLFSVYLV